MSVRSHTKGRKPPRPLRQVPKPVHKNRGTNEVVQKAGRILGKIGDYIATNQEAYARGGESTLDEDMAGLVRRVGRGMGGTGKSESQRIRSMCRRDSDDEICRFMTGQPEPEPERVFREKRHQSPPRSMQTLKPKRGRPSKVIEVPMVWSEEEQRWVRLV
jgi:hypothetical protein